MTNRYDPAALTPTPASLESALVRAAGLACARQARLLHHVEGRDWGIDLSEGLIRFGDDIAWPVQVVGSEHHDRDEWLWSWDNETVPAAVSHRTTRLADLGAAWGIAEMTAPRLSTDRMDAARAGALAATFLDGAPWFAPTDFGRVVFVALDLPPALTAATPVQGCLTAILTATEVFALPGRAVAEDFLRLEGFSLEHHPRGFVARRDGDAIEADVDGLGRLVELRATLAPNAAGEQQ